ncbi:MAG: Bug family tripartite tricarboxylate transporter substrate binding protein [Cupriavidus necator]
MNRLNRRRMISTLGAGLAVAALGCLHGPAWAAYPDKPITLVVPFPAGGPADGYGRALAAALSARLKQTVVVENRSGAGGELGVQAVARATPDGYTIGMAGSGATVFRPLLTDKVLFDVFKDVTLLSKMVRTPNILIVGPHVTAKTVSELIAQAKAQPGKLTIASAGVGSSPHVLAELFKQKAGLDILHVPYQGFTPALQGLMGGQVDMFFGEAAGVLPFVTAGKVRALFTADQKRARGLPDVPNADEVGLRDVVAEGSYGLVAPVGLPPAVAKQLTQAIAEALKSPEVAEKFDLQAGIPDASSGDQYAAYIKSERARWLPVIRQANIKLE